MTKNLFYSLFEGVITTFPKPHRLCFNIKSSLGAPLVNITNCFYARTLAVRFTTSQMPERIFQCLLKSNAYLSTLKPRVRKSSSRSTNSIDNSESLEMVFDA